MENPLKQQVNFYASVGLICVFGFLMAVTVVQAINREAPLVQHITSPIELDYARY